MCEFAAHRPRPGWAWIEGCTRGVDAGQICWGLGWFKVGVTQWLVGLAIFWEKFLRSSEVIYSFRIDFFFKKCETLDKRIGSLSMAVRGAGWCGWCWCWCSEWWWLAVEAFMFSFVLTAFFPRWTIRPSQDLSPTCTKGFFTISSGILRSLKFEI